MSSRTQRTDVPEEQKTPLIETPSRMSSIDTLPLEQAQEKIKSSRSRSNSFVITSPRVQRTPRERLQRALQHVRIALHWRKIAITVDTPEFEDDVLLEEMTREEMQERINSLRTKLYELDKNQKLVSEEGRQEIEEVRSKLREMTKYYREHH